MAKSNTVNAARARQEAWLNIRQVKCVKHHSHKYFQHFNRVSLLARLFVVYLLASFTPEGAWLISVADLCGNGFNSHHPPWNK